MWTGGLALGLAACFDGNGSGVSQLARPTATDNELLSLAAAQGVVADPAVGHVIPPANDAEVRLGRALFFSKTLSAEFNVACASCHHPLLGGGDGLSLSIGVSTVNPDVLGPARRLNPSTDKDPLRDHGPNVPRNAQTIFNTALYNRALFHDGRVFVLSPEVLPGGTGQPMRTPESLYGGPDANAGNSLLQAQARFPIVSFNEMRGFGPLAVLDEDVERERIAERLRGTAPDAGLMPHNDWLPLFRAAAGEPAGDAATLITPASITHAIGTYEASQTFVRSPWSSYLAGHLKAISDSAKRGAMLFLAAPDKGGLGCSSCHAGGHFTNETFQRTGFPQIGRGKHPGGADYGRRETTDSDDDRYRFRVPSLLNVEVTGPYGHDGAFDTLADVLTYHADPQAYAALYYVDYFQQGGLAQFAGTTQAYPHATELTAEAAATVSPLLPNRQLSAQELADLEAFLLALTDPCVKSPVCLTPWIPAVADDPDGMQLNALFTDPGTGGSGSGTGSGGSGGGSGSGSGTGTGGSPPPGPVISPISSRAAGIILCGHGNLSASGTSTFTDVAAAEGISHMHGFQLATWQAYNYLDMNTMFNVGGVAFGFIDGDCWPDTAWAAGDVGGNLYYLNRTDAGFEQHPLTLEPGKMYTGPMIADLDGDGVSELVFGNLFGGNIAIASGTNYGTLTLLPTSRTTFGMAAADAFNEGRLDLMVGHWDPNTVPGSSPAFWHNVGGLDFVPYDAVAGTSGAYIEQSKNFSPGFADINGDGIPDLLIASDWGTSVAMLGTAGGPYQNITGTQAMLTDENGMGSAIADFNNDGQFDWFVSSIWAPPGTTLYGFGITGNRLYMNNAGMLTDVSQAAGVVDGGWGWGVCAADFNNDGWLDIYEESGYAQLPPDARAAMPGIAWILDNLAPEFQQNKPHLFISNGDGTYTDRAAEWGIDTVNIGRGVACADFDRNGTVDVAVAPNWGPPRLYRNNSPTGPGAHFLEVRLVGPAGNTAGIGSVVKVTTGTLTQTRLVAVNSNFNGHDAPVAHVGLGPSGVIDQVQVRWPDGQVSSIANPPADSFLVVRHPSLDALNTASPSVQAAARNAFGAAVAFIDRPGAAADALLELHHLATAYAGLGVLPATDIPAAYAADIAAAQLAGDANETLRLQARQRLLGPVASPPAATDLAVLNDLSTRIVAQSLYCDIYPLDATWYMAVEAEIGNGGAGAAAALLATKFVSENNCISRHEDAWLENLLGTVYAAINLGDGTLDAVDIEAMAYLAHAGREDLIDPSWIGILLATQNPDGGWSTSTPVSGSVGASSDDVVTANAAWLLAQLLAQNADQHGLLP